MTTKTCYKVLKYSSEFNMKKHKNHLSSDWILNESDYSAGTTPVELGCFDTYEEAKALFESEKPNCDCDVIISGGIVVYSTNVLEIEVDKIEIDEDGFEDIVDCDFLDYYTVSYEPKQDDDDEEDEEDEDE